MDWLDLLAFQGILKSLLQHHSSKASILWCSAFFIVQRSHPYMTTGKTTALTRWTFVGKVMSLLFNMLSRFGGAWWAAVYGVAQNRTRLKQLSSQVGHKFSFKEQVSFNFWLQSPSAVILWSKLTDQKWDNGHPMPPAVSK